MNSLVNPLRILFLLLTTWVLATAAVAQGGPPLITDDPGTPGNGHWEINVAFTESRFSKANLYELPHIDLNYGYGANVQLKLEGPLTIYNAPGSNFASLGYTDWGVKWRFLEENKSRPALSTYPQILFLTNNALGRLGAYDPGTDLLLPLEVLKSLGAFQIDVEGGILFRQFAGTQFSTGVCAEYDLTKHFALLGEIHNYSQNLYVADQLIWNLGFKFDVSEHQSLLFSAGRSFGPSGVDSPAFQTYIGVQFRT